MTIIKNLTSTGVQQFNQYAQAWSKALANGEGQPEMDIQDFDTETIGTFDGGLSEDEVVEVDNRQYQVLATEGDGVFSKAMVVAISY